MRREAATSVPSDLSVASPVVPASAAKDYVVSETALADYAVSATDRTLEELEEG